MKKDKKFFDLGSQKYRTTLTVSIKKTVVSLELEGLHER